MAIAEDICGTHSVWNYCGESRFDQCMVPGMVATNSLASGAAIRLHRKQRPESAPVRRDFRSIAASEDTMPSAHLPRQHEIKYSAHVESLEAISKFTLENHNSFVKFLDEQREKARLSDAATLELQRQNVRLQHSMHLLTAQLHCKGCSSEKVLSKAVSQLVDVGRPPLPPMPLWFTEDSPRSPSAGKIEETKVEAMESVTSDTLVKVAPSPSPVFKRGCSVDLAQYGTEVRVPSKEPANRVSVRGFGANRALTGFFFDTDETQEGIVEGAVDVKARIRQAITKNDIRIDMYFHEKGIAQRLARSWGLEWLTLFVVALNSFWMSVDMELNDADVIIEADPVFIIAENFFCAFFFIEWFIRFLALKRKRDGLKDFWFVVDGALLLFMILDTWVMSLVLVFGWTSRNSVSEAQLVRLIKLMRLTRISRMVKLLRAFPEVMVLVKGIAVATRSVFFTLCLLLLVIYVFALFFRALCNGTDLEDMYFQSVQVIFLNLLIWCAFPDLISYTTDMQQSSFTVLVLFIFFNFLASFTILNMLVGILVEVVSTVSATESEVAEIKYVKSIILGLLYDDVDSDSDGMVSRAEFQELLKQPKAIVTLEKVGIDVINLIDFEDILFQEGGSNAELTFEHFMDTILELRGSNNATVKTITELRRHLNDAFNSIHKRIDKWEGLKPSSRSASFPLVTEPKRA